jgi:hypothetical protein
MGGGVIFPIFSELFCWCSILRRFMYERRSVDAEIILGTSPCEFPRNEICARGIISRGQHRHCRGIARRCHIDRNNLRSRVLNVTRKAITPYAQHLRVLKYKADKVPLRQIAQLGHVSYGMVTRLCGRKPVDLDRDPYFLRASTREHFQSEHYWRERLAAEHKRCSVITVGGCGSALRVRNGELSILEDGHERTYLPATHGFKAIIFEAFGGSSQQTRSLGSIATTST